MGSMNITVGQVAVAAAVGAFSLGDDIPEPYAGNFENDLNDAAYHDSITGMSECSCYTCKRQLTKQEEAQGDGNCMACFAFFEQEVG